jgi:hypothetical protein
MSAGINLILEGLKQRGLTTDWSTDEPVKTVTLPHIKGPSDWYKAARSDSSKTDMTELLQRIVGHQLEKEIEAKKVLEADFEKNYTVDYDSINDEPLTTPRSDSDSFLAKKGGAWTKAPKRTKGNDPTLKLKLPDAITIKPEWVRGEIESESELQQYFLGLINHQLAGLSRDFELMVKTPMTFMFRDRNWTFCGAEFYRLVAVAPSKDSSGTFDGMGYYFEAQDSGVEPKRLYGLNIAGFVKLFGQAAADDVIDQLTKVIRMNEQYLAAKAGFERKAQAATYAEEGIEFGSW